MMRTLVLLLLSCTPVLTVRRGATPETVSQLARRVCVIPHGEALLAQALVSRLNDSFIARDPWFELVLPASTGRPAGPVDLVVHVYVTSLGPMRTVGVEAVTPSGELLKSVAQTAPVADSVQWAESLVDAFYASHLHVVSAHERELDIDEASRPGRSQVMAGRFDTARRMFELAHLRNPKAPSPLYNLGVLAEAAGSLGQARDFYQQALRLGPYALAAQALATLPAEP